MRKWICVGVLGGILEFGIVYQIAFSGSDSPAPETLRTSETSGSKTNRQAKAAARRSARHIASAAGTTQRRSSGCHRRPGGRRQRSRPDTGHQPAAPASPAAGTLLLPLKLWPPQPPAADPLTATLKAAASAVAALPMSLGPSSGPVAGALIPGIPVSLAGLPPINEVEDLAQVIPLPTVAPAPAPAPRSTSPNSRSKR